MWWYWTEPQQSGYSGSGSSIEYRLEKWTETPDKHVCAIKLSLPCHRKGKRWKEWACSPSALLLLNDKLTVLSWLDSRDTLLLLDSIQHIFLIKSSRPLLFINTATCWRLANHVVLVYTVYISGTHVTLSVSRRKTYLQSKMWENVEIKDVKAEDYLFVVSYMLVSYIWFWLKHWSKS